MKVAQALLQSWKEEKLKDTDCSKIAPLEHFLKYQYTERYVKLCRWLNVEPVKFGAWLRKDITEIQ